MSETGWSVVMGQFGQAEAVTTVAEPPARPWMRYGGDELGPEYEVTPTGIRVNSPPIFCLDCGTIPVSIPRLGIGHACMPCDPWEAVSRMASTIHSMLHPEV